MKAFFTSILATCLFLQQLSAAERTFEYLSSALFSEARDVEVSGDLAYALFTSGLLVLDVSTPEHPRLASFRFFPVAPRDIRIMDDLAVVADSSAGIQVLDITDPAAPTLRGTFPSDTSALCDAAGLDISGDVLFVANGSRGFLVLTLSDPDNPAVLSELEGVAPSMSVDVEGGHAFLASLQHGIRAVDVSDPSDPIPVGGLSDPPYLAVSRDIRVCGSYAYVADNLGLATVDVSDPENLAMTSYITTSGRALDLYIDDPCLYLADDVSGFHVFEILQDPAQPRWLSFYDTPDDARGIAAGRGLAAVADDYTGLMIFDITDPSAPEYAGLYPSAGESRGGVLRGDLAYVSQGNRGLVIMDLEDPIHPDTVSCITENVSFVHSLDVGGGLMAVANGFRGLMVMDVSDPSSPLLLGEATTGRQLVAVRIAGNNAFAVDGNFHAFDLSVPSSPEVLSSYNTAGAATDLALAGDFAFVADYSEGVSSFRVSSPADSLMPLDDLDTEGYAVGIAARDGFVYLADRSGGFHILRYDDDGRMEGVSRTDLGDEAVDVALDGDVAFLALDRGEIVALDIGDPFYPVELDRFPTPGKSVALDAESSMVLVGDRSSTIFLEFTPDTGVEEYPPYGPMMPRGTVSLLQNCPNPFNPSTHIRFSVSSSDDGREDELPVSLEVYDLRGRFVATLYRGRGAAGEHVVTWDGTNSGGEAVSSGVYMYVLKMGDVNLARKMLLVR